MSYSSESDILIIIKKMNLHLRNANYFKYLYVKFNVYSFTSNRIYIYLNLLEVLRMQISTFCKNQIKFN